MTGRALPLFQHRRSAWPSHAAQANPGLRGFGDPVNADKGHVAQGRARKSGIEKQGAISDMIFARCDGKEKRPVYGDVRRFLLAEPGKYGKQDCQAARADPKNQNAVRARGARDTREPPGPPAGVAMRCS